MELQNLKNNMSPESKFWNQLRLVYKKPICLTNRVEEKQAAKPSDIIAAQKAPQKQMPP